ncbi:unnamed protein product [Albugo candida]|uniref:Uncharacterized protein n=1 Tax=Albugo candida TaxID=65357 RepID=A0A024FT15_9STRA|nr:unnamed protein product [Albugo candida]|eukprot:CCI10225.1 unnamed protein product [Albugo candida]
MSYCLKQMIVQYCDLLSRRWTNAITKWCFVRRTFRSFDIKKTLFSKFDRQSGNQTVTERYFLNEYSIAATVTFVLATTLGLSSQNPLMPSFNTVRYSRAHADIEKNSKCKISLDLVALIVPPDERRYLLLAIKGSVDIGAQIPSRNDSSSSMLDALTISEMLRDTDGTIWNPKAAHHDFLQRRLFKSSIFRRGYLLFNSQSITFGTFLFHPFTLR